MISGLQFSSHDLTVWGHPVCAAMLSPCDASDECCLSPLCWLCASWCRLRCGRATSLHGPQCQPRDRSCGLLGKLQAIRDTDRWCHCMFPDFCSTNYCICVTFGARPHLHFLARYHTFYWSRTSILRGVNGMRPAFSIASSSCCEVLVDGHSVIIAFSLAIFVVSKLWSAVLLPTR